MPAIRRLALPLLTALAVAAALAASGARSAGPFDPPDGVTCTFDPQSNVLRIDYGVPGEGRGQAPMVWISRVGNVIRIEEGLPGPGPNVPCDGGRATVRNTDRIELAQIMRLRTSETYITIGDRGLAPGATPEPGGDEIEIDTNLAANAQIHVNGGRDRDRFVFGSRGNARHLVNLNAAERRPDADLKITTTPRSLSANLGPGNNEATALGRVGTGSPLRIGLLLIGDQGNDRFVGSPKGDELLGYFGNDVLIGGPGDDRLDIVGGKGRDVLICGPGRDEYRSSAKDRVRC